MKRSKKPLAVLGALLLALLMSIGALAAGPVYTLTLRNSGATEHTFQIYQIFTGDLSVNESGSKVLSNIVWGSGVTAAGQSALGSAAAKAEALETEADAKAFADALVSGGYLTAPVTRTVAAGADAAIEGLAAGYYLIKDQDATQAVENGAYTAYLLEVVGDVTAATKLDIPSVEKKVQDINDSGDADISDNPWQDSADHDVGDRIPYRLTGTLPGNFGEYETYYYQFTDEMCAGLTYQADAKVYIVNGNEETDITEQAVCAPASATAGATLTVTIEDLKALTGVTADQNSRIVVRYTAILNEDAAVGSAGNPNTVFLTYSNNPNPGGAGTGATPKDKTIVFTYQLIVSKVDERDNPLENAGFTLYKKDAAGAWQTVKEIAAGSQTVFTFSGLDDGDYKLVESQVPEGYNKIEDIQFTLSAEHETDSANPMLISLNGATADGQVITLVGTQQGSVSLSSGAVSTEIVNRTGAILPSTGGVGTKIFYIVGGVMVAGAVVLLITQKRMSAED